MNKMKKMICISMCIIFSFFAAAIPFFLYAGAHSDECIQYEAELKKEAQNLTNGLISELDQLNTFNGDRGGTSGYESIFAAISSDELSTPGESQLQNEKKKEISESLAIAHRKVLEAQKQIFFDMAYNLIAQGKSDWSAMKARGENTPENKGMLMSEYLAKANALEEQMDASFYSLIDKIEEQLIAEGIDPSQTVAQYESEYERIKQSNKDALMKKVMEFADT